MVETNTLSQRTLVANTSSILGGVSEIDLKLYAVDDVFEIEVEYGVGDLAETAVIDDLRASDLLKASETEFPDLMADQDAYQLTVGQNEDFVQITFIHKDTGHRVLLTVPRRFVRTKRKTNGTLAQSALV